jgi:hypothetical protein
MAPLMEDEVAYGSWVNSRGEEEVYFFGSHSGSHVCACSVGQTCSDSDVGKTCNCDASNPQWESDAGALTDQAALPVTAFVYGKLEFDAQMANVTIGRLVCSGSNEFDAAASCNDLWLAGETRSGYYTVKYGGNHIRNNILLRSDMCLRILCENEQDFEHTRTAIYLSPNDLLYHIYLGNILCLSSAKIICQSITH